MSAKKKIIKINWLDHFIGFISVLLGVLIAFGLNNQKETSNKEKAIKIALKNICEEMDKNRHQIDSVQKHNMLSLKVLRKMMPYVDENFDVLERDSVVQLIHDYPDFRQLGNDTTFEATLQFVYLSYTAWETAERTNVLSYMDYELVSDIAVLYDYQADIDKKYQEVFDEFADIKQGSQVNGLNKQRLKAFISEAEFTYSLRPTDPYIEIINRIKGDL